MSKHRYEPLDMPGVPGALKLTRGQTVKIWTALVLGVLVLAGIVVEAFQLLH